MRNISTRKVQYIILTNYGYGWEEESSADTREEAEYQAEEYIKTACHPAVRIKKKSAGDDGMQKGGEEISVIGRKGHSY